jgi:hypothetical protein
MSPNPLVPKKNPELDGGVGKLSSPGLKAGRVEFHPEKC